MDNSKETKEIYFSINFTYEEMTKEVDDGGVIDLFIGENKLGPNTSTKANGEKPLEANRNNSQKIIICRMKYSEKELYFSKKTLSIYKVKNSSVSVFASKHEQRGIYLYILTKALDPCCIQVFWITDEKVEEF